MFSLEKWRRAAGSRRDWAWGLLAALATALLHFAAFPPWNVAEAAYVFALPMLGWLLMRPPALVFGACAWLGGWISWALLLAWLRHVYPPWGWVACLLLSGVLAVFPMAWFLLARWLLPPALDRRLATRLLVLAGLGGAWILLEWLKTWVLTGFPWLPLAASQWQRPAMLQSLPFAGYYGLSFILIFFNLALLSYGWRLRPRELAPEVSRRWRLRFCPEFYLALAATLASVWGYVATFPRQASREPMLNVAAVQPWIPAELKWDRDMFFEILDVLAGENARAATLDPKPDLILWPEAATPLPVIEPEDRGMGQWVQERVDETGVPLITGALANLPDGWVNGVFAFEPGEGMRQGYYAKRRLVPFGEYVPMRQWLFFVDKVVPLDIDLRPGEHSRPLLVEARGRQWQAGPLICYEDIFARLGRQAAAEGADFLFVVTNDGWYGEEAGAYQHAAHAVLRAVETRRPVVRCGNHGWSGWIDEYGNVRGVLTGEDGLVYLRGSQSFALSRDPAWGGRQTFYTRMGDWPLGAGVVCLVGAVFWRRRLKA